MVTSNMSLSRGGFARSFKSVALILVAAVSILGIIFRISKPAEALPGDYIWQQVGSTGLPAAQMNWRTAASSSDGTKLAVGVSGGYIYTSTDSGATWTERTASGSRFWQSMTGSADGTRLSAVVNGGYIYTSADSGATWAEHDALGALNWRSIASSSDGTKLAIVDQSGYIYTSTDFGENWTQQTGSSTRNWGAIASSSDGTKLAAIVSNGFIYTSADSGVTWTEQANSGVRNWTSLASSADGTKLVAGVWGGYIYTSTDSGATWTQRTAAGSRSWASVISSSDGAKIAAVDYYGSSYNGGYIYTSTNSGSTWNEHTSVGARYWSAVAGSTDGASFFAAPYGGLLYQATTETATATHDYSTTSAPVGTDDVVALSGLSVTSASCYTIENGSTVLYSPTGLAASEANITILGGLGYSLTCASSGGSATVTVTLGTYYSDLTKLRVYKKAAASSTLVDVTSLVTLANTVDGSSNPITTLTYTLTDGADFDEDTTANSTIVDPLYIGLESAPTDDPVVDPADPTNPADPTETPESSTVLTAPNTAIGIL